MIYDPFSNKFFILADIICCFLLGFVKSNILWEYMNLFNALLLNHLAEHLMRQQDYASVFNMMIFSQTFLNTAGSIYYLVNRNQLFDSITTFIGIGSKNMCIIFLFCKHICGLIRINYQTERSPTRLGLAMSKKGNAFYIIMKSYK